MKFKLLYSLSLAAIVAGGGLMYGTADGHNAVKNDKKKPAKTGVVYSDLREVIDTVYVTNENLDTVRFTGAAGQFNCVNNTVHISYYVANSSLPRIQMYVDGCNAMIPMVRRHETEHARKALMTKRLNHLSVNSRAAVAAMNEIMAPASEIIELMDYPWRTGQELKYVRPRMLPYREQIRQIVQARQMIGPVDFNDTQIADLTIQYGMDAFLSSFNRGIYRHAIRQRLRPNVRYAEYIPHKQCDFIGAMFFNPEFGWWGPMWEFETQRGRVDLWRAASQQQRDKLIALVDSVTSVCR